MSEIEDAELLLMNKLLDIAKEAREELPAFQVERAFRYVHNRVCDEDNDEANIQREGRAQAALNDPEYDAAMASLREIKQGLLAELNQQLQGGFQFGPALPGCFCPECIKKRTQKMN